MAEPHLGPDELDRLEDALEGLGDSAAVRDPSERVAQRLADYQLILQASRDALPLEDVRPGVLDGILAEAQRSAGRVEADAPSEPTPSFWSRLRGAWLVPGLAVAGSAALVLVLLQPTLQQADRAEDVAMADTRRAPAEVPAAADSPVRDGFDDAEGAAPSGVAAGADAPPPPAAPAPAGEVLYRQKAELPLEEDVRSREGAGPRGGWDAIEDGDAARKGGDCFTARNHYARALDDGNDSVRARAYVGMGLCKREEGNDAAANDYFDKASRLDRDAVEFAGIQAEERRAKPKRPRKRSAKSKVSREPNNNAKPLQGL